MTIIEKILYGVKIINDNMVAMNDNLNAMNEKIDNLTAVMTDDNGDYDDDAPNEGDGAMQ